MAVVDIEFNNICKETLKHGRNYKNKRRDVERKQIPSYTFRHEFKDGFPAITSKKLQFRKAVVELHWFLSGNNNIKFLNENNVKYWNKDAYNWHVKNSIKPMSFEEFCERGEGSVGQNYSKQWRDYAGQVDQVKEIINGMRSDIMGSRLILEAWNPAELDKTALPPCHKGFQIIGVPLGNDKYGFELHWWQRSVDLFNGAPINIASYALLAKKLERITGYKALAIQGDLKCVHFYDNQYTEARLISVSDAYKHGNCELKIEDDGQDFMCIDSALAAWGIDSFKLEGYTSEKAINVPMLAPKTL